jgi:hypothetical protein
MKVFGLPGVTVSIDVGCCALCSPTGQRLSTRSNGPADRKEKIHMQNPSDWSVLWRRTGGRWNIGHPAV